MDSTPSYSHCGLPTRYFDLGWSLVLIKPNGKEAAVKWETYQFNRADLETVAQWLETPGNIGVINGEVSGNLACRDFDDVDTFGTWASTHPELASKLPVVGTAQRIPCLLYRDT